jgi:protein-S-isoprenylcysteine O-methyltransferase Ste14
MALIKNFRLGRFIWTAFVTWYFINFSRNFFSSLIPDQAKLPTIFFLILVLWMALEYYFGSPFYQTGIIPPPTLERVLFSIFFYANTIYCIADYSNLHWTQLSFLYPYLNVIGLVLFAIGVILRYYTLFELLKLPPSKLPRSGFFNVCRHPRYLATTIQVIAIPLVFTSYLGLIIAITIELFLIYREMQAEEKSLTEMFKEEYPSYKNNVPFILPKLSRLSLVKSIPVAKGKTSKKK